jgi:broad specificity phosphatase PhoE
MGAIYLIRHGQASFGKSDYDQLSDTGFEQARVLGTALAQRIERLDAVVTGAMLRHRQTADACLSGMASRAPRREMPGFNEFDHEQLIHRYEPRYQNRLALMADMALSLKPRRAFQQMFEKAVARWIGGEHDADYDESWPAFRARCISALDELLASLGASKTALVFTSGGPITAICQDLLKIPDAHAFRLNWTLANCAVTKIVYSERGRYLSTLNEHAHFEGANAHLITYR